jgi:hypothetical protein
LNSSEIISGNYSQGQLLTSRAVFWSSRKVKEAHDGQQQRVQEKEQQQLQKAERGCVLENQKQAKL